MGLACRRYAGGGALRGSAGVLGRDLCVWGDGALCFHQHGEQTPRLPIGPSALVDAAIFGVIAFGIWKESRVAAVAGLCVYVLEQFYMLIVSAPRGISGFFVIAALLCAFLAGIRETYALHDMRGRGFD
jgi:hypothetical protein